ncbi:MAG: DUF3105 domain-containing protein [Solirubrobacterales bacterium]
MSSRREDKERLRAERLAAESREQSQARRRLIAGYFVAGLLGAAVLAGLVVVLTSGGGGDGDGGDAPGNAHIQHQSGTFANLEADGREGTPPPEIQFGDLEQSAQEAGCELKLNLPDEGNGHVPDSTPVQYKTVPPTSGNHNAEPLADGAYTTPLGNDTTTSPNIRNAVHSMEHGRIEIQYKPSLPEDQQLALKGVFDEDPGGMLMFPNSDIPDDVAVTAWTNEAVCPSYDPVVLDVIRNFRDTYRGNGPEQQIPINLG